MLLRKPSIIDYRNPRSGLPMSRLFGRMVVGMMPLMPRFVIRWVSRRYVAGVALDDALKVMMKLATEDACFTVDVLGEEISRIEESEFFIKEYNDLIDMIVEKKLDANLSIKPTAFGLHIDREVGLSNIETLLRKAAQNDIFVRLDMEDHRVTDDTIEVCLAMHQMGLKNIGVVLQGRLFRTLEDIESICNELGCDADFRICKGIYLEPEEIAHTGYQAIVDATNAAIDKMLDSSSYVAIASHDVPVIEHSLAALSQRGMGPVGKDPRDSPPPQRSGKGEGYEFQMLLGVRGDIRRRLAAEGHRTRVYIPYGERWYEYSMRRLRENPTVAWHVTKALLMPWSNRR